MYSNPSVTHIQQKMSYIPPHMLVGSYSLAANALAKQSLVNKDWNAIVQPKLESLKAEFLESVVPGLGSDTQESVSSSGLAYLLKNAHDESAFVPDRIFKEERTADNTALFFRKGLAQLNVARTPAIWFAWACLYLTYLLREPSGTTSIHEVLSIKYQAAKYYAKAPGHLWTRLQSLACELIDDL